MEPGTGLLPMRDGMRTVFVQQAEKFFLPDFDAENTSTNKPILNNYNGIQIFMTEKTGFGIAWIQTGRIWRELWQSMILQ